MTIGPGKYDDELTKVMEATKASCGILIIFNGNKGQGFCSQVTPDIALAIPSMLRQIATEMEIDLQEEV